MSDRIALLLEAERRGILPPEKVAALAEARKRGLVPSGESAPSKIVGDGETVGSMQAKFWNASRSGDKATALDMLRRLKAEGKNTGAPPNMAQDAARNTADSDSQLTNHIAGFGQGMRKAGRGIMQAQQMANPAYWLSPKVRASVDNMLPDNPEADAGLNKTVGGMVQNITGQAVPFAVAPEVSGVKGAMGLAGLQGFAAPLPTGQNTLPNRLIGATVAAPIGGMGYVATRGAADKAAGMGRRNYSDESRATIEAANRLAARTNGAAPLTSGDLGNPFVRQTQDVLFENIPGAGRVREMTRQQGAVIRGVDDLKTRFPETADHPESIMQRSAIEAQKGAKTEAGRLYDAVDVESRAAGVPGIKTPQSAQALQAALKQYPELLSGISNSVTRAKIQSLLSRNPLSMSFANTREVMKAINGALKDATKAQATGASGSADAVLHLGRLSRALSADQQAWAQQAGGPTMAALNRANAHFAEKVAPYRNQAELRNLVKPDANPQGLLRTSQDSFETAERLMKAMTPEGQDAYRRGLVQRAIEKGTREDGKLNLRTLINNLPTGRAAEKIFSPADLEVLNDLARYARAVDRSLDVGNTPLTGKVVAKMAVAPAVGAGTGTFVGLPAVAGGLVLANITRRMASSRVLRSMLGTSSAESSIGRLAAGRVALPASVAAGNTYGLSGLMAAPRVEQRER